MKAASPARVLSVIPSDPAGNDHRPAVPLTVVTSEQPGRLTKRFSLFDDGLVKQHAGSVMKGAVRVVDIRRPSELVALLEGLASHQALIFGRPPTDEARLVAADDLPTAPPGSIARTADAFRWNNGPGWMMLDYDPPSDGPAMTRDEWLRALYSIVPELEKAPTVWGVSSSSEIWRADTGQQLAGVRGQRLYVLVEDASDIPRAGAALFDRLWLAGLGYHFVSKSGALLRRGPVDAAVWQANRIDFAAPPVCEPPLEARRPSPVAYNNDETPLATRTAIPPLSPTEASVLKKMHAEAAAEAGLRTRQQEAMARWIDDRLAACAGLPEGDRDVLRERLTDAVTRHRLFGDFDLVHSSGKRITVGQILDDPDRWHNERFHDPLEPDYSNADRRIAWANLRSGGPPSIYSHAHGGRWFRLLRPVAVCQLEPGEMPNIVPAMLERIRIDAEIFERGGQLVRLADAELVTVERPWLQTYLESAFEFQRYDARTKGFVRKDCPDQLAARVLAARGGWHLPKVAGVVTFPVMRADGSVLDRPGFDDATGLLHLHQTQETVCPHVLAKLELRAALGRIWQPFSDFPFADDLSRGVFLAALLTTVCRAAIDTAPGFLIRAHSAGTGKTLLSECLMLLVGAKATAMPLPEGNAEEIEKRLFAKLLSGCAGLILDNLVGVIDNAALCAFLTSARPEGRILGRSETPSVINRALWVLNGNNVTAGGDTFRRILPITLDANTERPETRQFNFNPRTLIRERLSAYRTDLLSVLLTFQNEGAPRHGTGSLGSFETWEGLVRQCVCWLIHEKLAPVAMCDPLEVLELSRAEDPGRDLHAAVLGAWYAMYGAREVKVRELAKLAETFGPMGNSEAVLRDVLGEFVDGRQGFNSRRFGGWLRRHKGMVVAGMRVDPGPSPGKDNTWRVTATAAGAAQAA